MYSILIADDEKFVRQDIRNSVDWNHYGFYIIGEAENGRDALQKIKEWQPDILITDIRMPFINGIDLIAEAVRLQPSLRTVIISGYEDFKYAQQAISLHVVSYLTKPIDEASVISILTELHNDLSTENKQNTASANNYPSAVADTKHLPVNNVQRYFFLFGYLPFSISAKESMNPNFVSSLKTKLTEFCIKTFSDASIKIDSDVISGHIFVYTFYISGLTRAGQEKIALFLQMEMQTICRLIPVLALTPISDNPEKTQTLRTSCLQFLNTRMLHPGSIIWYQVSQTLNQDFVLHITETIEKFRNAVLAQKSAEAEQYLDDLLDTQNTSAYNSELLEYIVHETSTLLRRLVLIYQDKISPALYQDLFDSFYLMTFPSVAALKLDLLKRMKAIFSAIHQMDDSDIITIIKKYINSHYEQDISLPDIAAEFFFNPSYLSYLFKQKTGGNISTYIEKIRVKEALRLLDTTKYTVSEVARMVGYNDPNYFTRIFKRHTGFTPNHYIKKGKNNDL